jgi:hypothetical protein
MAPYLGPAFHGLLRVLELAPFGTGTAVVSLIKVRRASRARRVPQQWAPRTGIILTAATVHACAAV